MAVPTTLLLSAFSGGSSMSRQGDIVIVKFPASTFATSAADYHQAQVWARARASTGNAQVDRTAFVGRFENLLARGGGGLATKGNRPALRVIVRSLVQFGAVMSLWSVPHDIDASMEVAKRPAKAAPDPAADAPG